MRKLLFLFLLFPLFVQAQDSAYSVPPSSFVIFKFSPLSILDPVSSYQFAVEYKAWEKAISLQHEAGYITNIPLYETDNRGRRGIRLRNEIRFYLEPRGKKGEGAYVAPELLFIQYSYEKTATICHGSDWENFGCNYREKVDYKVQKQVFAFHPKIGFQSIYKRLTVDIYVGPGFRHVRIEEKGKPVQEFEEDDFLSFRKRPGIYNLPGMTMGFKVGYLLSKKDR